MVVTGVPKAGNTKTLFQYLSQEIQKHYFRQDILKSVVPRTALLTCKLRWGRPHSPSSMIATQHPRPRLTLSRQTLLPILIFNSSSIFNFHSIRIAREHPRPKLTASQLTLFPITLLPLCFQSLCFHFASTLLPITLLSPILTQLLPHHCLPCCLLTITFHFPSLNLLEAESFLLKSKSSHISLPQVCKSFVITSDPHESN